MDYLPSHHSALQIVNLDEFTETTGVVVVGCFSITKGLKKTRGRQGLLTTHRVLSNQHNTKIYLSWI